MILGLSTFGFVHTALSLLALAFGLVVVTGLVTTKRQNGWTALYFASAVAADATGFMFPGEFRVPQLLGLIAAVGLGMAILARYVFRLASAWRQIYIVATMVSVHILVVFTIGEIFLRVPTLNAMAPTLTEKPFALVQLVAFVLFAGLAVAAVVRSLTRHSPSSN